VPILAELLSVPPESIVVADVGAAFFGDVAPYQPLREAGLCKLFAFEPDERLLADLQRHLGPGATIFPYAIGDGREARLHVCPFGMTSLLEPDPRSLAFFNLFPEFGKIETTTTVSTRRLDEVDDLPAVDYLKIDVQGSELRIFQNARKKLKTCAAIQTEISFITLYKGQPAFGEIDRELRFQGFIPHCFTNVKCWSIAPTHRDNDPRKPFNQLLEADIVYVRDVVNVALLSRDQLTKIAVIADHCYQSVDLAIRCMLELRRRSLLSADAIERYMGQLNQKPMPAG
jgi:FkbM family methyltransferase